VALTVSIKIGLPLRRLLPYWAVFSNDLSQTLRGGLFRACGVIVLALCVGLLVHRSAIHHEAHIMQYASLLVGELLRFGILVGSTVVIVLSAGAISGERDSLADAVLCRGVSRWQYFMGKWHSRLLSVVGGMSLLSLMVIGVCMVLLQSDLTLLGCALAIGLVAAMFAVVVTAGVALSAVVDSAVLGIALLWIGIYGAGATLYYLRLGTFDFPRLLKVLPDVLRGHTDPMLQLRLIGGFCLGAVCVAILGALAFSRRDL
jgi:ABC-2 type transport system permease protein